MMGPKIAPSILSADFSDIAASIREIEGSADLLHVDVMDGHFVPNITIGPVVVKALRKSTKLPLDVHLMISNPDRFVPEFAKAGADIITIHAEACTHLHRSVWLVKNAGRKVGVALNPATPLSCLEHVLADIDLALLMSVNPGFEAQSFIPSVIPKIKSFRKTISEKGLETEIEVDGGINEETAPLVVDAGASILVAGSAIFHGSNPAQAAKKIREAASLKHPVPS